MPNEEDALNYVIGTNGLEDIKLSREDIKKIMLDIQNGKRDKSFLYELVMEIRAREEEMRKNGRTKI